MSADLLGRVGQELGVPGLRLVDSPPGPGESGALTTIETTATVASCTTARP